MTPHYCVRRLSFSFSASCDLVRLARYTTISRSWKQQNKRFVLSQMQKIQELNFFLKTSIFLIYNNFIIPDHNSGWALNNCCTYLHNNNLHIINPLQGLFININYETILPRLYAFNGAQCWPMYKIIIILIKHTTEHYNSFYTLSDIQFII